MNFQLDEQKTIRLSTFLSNFRAGIILEDFDRKILFANKSFCELFLLPYSPEQLVGKNSVIFAEQGAHLLKNKTDYFTRIEEIILKREIVYKDTIELSDGRVIEIDYLPIENVGHLWQFHDISTHKQTEFLLKNSKEEVEKLNKTLEEKVEAVVKKSRETDHLVMQQARLAAMGEMIGNIGHQWRQPLNILSLYIQDMKDSYEFNELTKEYLNEAVEKCFLQIRHMSRTINDFRNFFHPLKEEILFSPIEQIKTAIAIISATLEEANIVICFHNQSEKNVLGFPNEFSQVVINLLINCRNVYVARKIEDKQVEIIVADDKFHVTVQIIDRAGGIPTAILEKIFDPYFTTKANGTGVGLYMSKMIMERMNGTITVDNQGNGAIFTLKIPISNCI